MTVARGSSALLAALVVATLLMGAKPRRAVSDTVLVTHWTGVRCSCFFWEVVRRRVSRRDTVVVDTLKSGYSSLDQSGYKWPDSLARYPLVPGPERPWR